MRLRGCPEENKPSKGGPVQEIKVQTKRPLAGNTSQTNQELYFTKISKNM